MKWKCNRNGPYTFTEEHTDVIEYFDKICFLFNLRHNRCGIYSYISSRFDFVQYYDVLVEGGYLNDIQKEEIDERVNYAHRVYELIERQTKDELEYFEKLKKQALEGKEKKERRIAEFRREFHRDGKKEKYEKDIDEWCRLLRWPENMRMAYREKKKAEEEEEFRLFLRCPKEIHDACLRAKVAREKLRQSSGSART
jgi:hypothetical protein